MTIARTEGLQAGDVFTAVITAPCGWLTANSRSHRLQEANKIRLWRAAAATAARAQHLPVGVERVRIDCEFRFRGRAPVRDRSNLDPTVKAIVDGLGPARTRIHKGLPHRSPGHGLVVDDSDRHVDGPYHDIGPSLGPELPYRPLGEVLVKITVVVP